MVPGGAQRWYYSTRVDRHNHDASFDPGVHPAHRKLSEEQRQDLRHLMRTTTATTRDITAAMRAKYPDQPWKRKDVENEAIRTRNEALGGYTPTQALIKIFQEDKVKHYVRQLDGHVSGLVWTYPWCEEMWKRNPEVLSMDNTYKTNRFKMPFLNVTGITSTDSTFNMAFGLLNREDEEAYI